MTDRDRDREGSVSSMANEAPEVSSILSASSSGGMSTASQANIDILFEPDRRQTWEPPKPPQVLGELLDSRYMLPLLFPSDPRMLAVLPGKLPDLADDRRPSPAVTPSTQSANKAGAGPVVWRSRNRRLREIGVTALKSVDGNVSVTRWTRAVPDEEEYAQVLVEGADDENLGEDSKLQVDTRDIPFTRSPSGRTRGRPSIGDDQTTPV
jgi:hypothetical protein